jgi:predicted DNA-binding protein
MAVVKKLISMDESIANELKIVSKALNKTQRNIIEDALDSYFDYTDAIVADKITQEIKNGKMRVMDSEDVYKKLGIEIED